MERLAPTSTAVLSGAARDMPGTRPVPPWYVVIAGAGLPYSGAATVYNFSLASRLHLRSFCTPLLSPSTAYQPLSFPNTVPQIAD